MLPGTGWPCSASTSEILKKHCGTVVLPGTGAPCCFSGLRDWFLPVCAVFCVFIFWLFRMYLGVMWVT